MPVSPLLQVPVKSRRDLPAGFSEYLYFETICFWYMSRACLVHGSSIIAEPVPSKFNQIVYLCYGNLYIRRTHNFGSHTYKGIWVNRRGKKITNTAYVIGWKIASPYLRWEFVSHYFSPCFSVLSNIFSPFLLRNFSPSSWLTLTQLCWRIMQSIFCGHMFELFSVSVAVVRGSCVKTRY